MQAPLSQELELEKLTGDLRFAAGLAWSRQGFLVASDTHRKQLYRVDPGAKLRVLREHDDGAAGIAYDIQGRLYLCEAEGRRISRMSREGDAESFLDNFEGKKFNAPHSVTVRRDGHVYFTDPAFGSAADQRTLDFNGIFHATPKAELSAIARWKTRPSGLALSPDGRLLYVADADRHAIVMFDVDRNGAATNPRDFTINIAGVPLGIQTDVNGRVYVCAHGVAVFSPQGKLERTLVEDRNTAACCFGEAEGDILFIASRGEITRARLGVKGALQY